jgi:hypothetical protein
MIEKDQQVGQTNRTDLLKLMLESVTDEELIEVGLVCGLIKDLTDRSIQIYSPSYI